MRSTRALLATLGTSISLVAAGVVALFAVSTFVAFKGWPGIDDGGSAARTPGLVLRTAAPAVSPAATLAAAARTLAVRPGRRPQPPPRSATKGPRERSPAAPGPISGDTPTPASPVAATPTPASGTGS